METKEDKREANPNSNARVLASGALAHVFTKQDAIKGGQSKSDLKSFRAIINGLMSRKDITDTERVHLALLKTGAYLDILQSYLAQDIIYAEQLQIDDQYKEAFEVRQTLSQKLLKLMEFVKENKPVNEGKIDLATVMARLDEMKGDQKGIVDAEFAREEDKNEKQ